ncbi:MAG: YjbQ family protein, partial [Gammaproteobacteria bacterium]|nr:YjbQ family protein [Gammaproteobacteria bacterium]
TENADPDVRRDLENYFSDLVPESRNYIHDAEGKDDMPAHIRTALTETSINVPVSNARLLLGTWQGIYLWEHRDMGHIRKIVVTVSGD